MQHPPQRRMVFMLRTVLHLCLLAGIALLASHRLYAMTAIQGLWPQKPHAQSSAQFLHAQPWTLPPSMAQSLGIQSLGVQLLGVQPLGGQSLGAQAWCMTPFVLWSPLDRYLQQPCADMASTLQIFATVTEQGLSQWPAA